jgi:hexosaminidase
MDITLNTAHVPARYLHGIQALRGFLPFSLDAAGTILRVDETEDALSVSFDGREARIGCATGPRFFRGLGLLVEHMTAGAPFSLSEAPQFRSLGAMLDCSRNAVLAPRTVDALLARMALMGFDTLMLYTEDTYTVEGEPFFGYMRGRYSQEEMRLMDARASDFGIELVPCVQTLAHLEQYLRWEAAAEHRDTADVLLAGDDSTYALIERMLRSASAPVRSRRIHLGMDEAHSLGLGRYLDRNGYRARAEIMRGHLQRVCGICERLGLSPMIWSDMFFRTQIRGGGYYDPDVRIPADAARGMPADLTIVYWDYYHDDERFYSLYLDAHASLGLPVAFAGGIYTYAGMFPNYDKSLRTAAAALSACKAHGVGEVIVTAWNDNGAECNHFADLLGLQAYAEHAYRADAPSMEDLARRLAVCAGASAEDFMAMGSLDCLPGVEEGGLERSNPSRWLLWQDPLLGLFDEHVRGMPLREHYGALAGRLRGARERPRVRPEYARLFRTAEALCRVLEMKADLGMRIRDAYARGDRAGLARIADGDIPELIGRVAELHEAHRDMWMSTNKPFGWEVTDIRYGGLTARLSSARRRLAAFAAGELAEVEELAEPRPRFDGADPRRGPLPGHFNLYHRIAAPGSFQ